MAKIHHLSSSVISSIAAGEIAERPAIIVKELIENALDAHANSIKISIEKSGLQRIVVSDNGEGMDTEDVLLSVQRHTTSKIKSAEDLFAIHSFGFRGEALASIASASKLTLQSKTATNSEGTQLIIENEKVIDTRPIGIPTGTTVIVEKLFQHMPARLKFLKSPQTELRHIVDVVTSFALSHPEVGFFFTHNQKILLFVPAGQDFPERLSTLLGEQIGSTLLEVSFEKNTYKIHGVIGTPQIARHTNQNQYLFVNQRAVTHLPIAAVIKETYGTLLEPRAEPLFVLHLEAPTSVVDINIHPRKEAVRFSEEAAVLEIFLEAIKESLHPQNISYLSSTQLAENSAFNHLNETTPHYDANSPQISRNRKSDPATASALKKTIDPWQLTPSATDLHQILQIDRTYLVAPTVDGFLITDQHAAHERILYEQFSAAFQNFSEQNSAKNSPPQNSELSPPVTIALSFSESQTLRDQLEIFQKIGFSIEHFGGQTYKITHVPQLLKSRDLSALFHELLEDLSAGKPLKEFDSISARTLAYLACRNAVKAGDQLSEKQRQELLEKLAVTKNRFTCPHGRPTTILFTIKDLEKMFKRR